MIPRGVPENLPNQYALYNSTKSWSNLRSTEPGIAISLSIADDRLDRMRQFAVDRHIFLIDRFQDKSSISQVHMLRPACIYQSHRIGSPDHAGQVACKRRALVQDQAGPVISVHRHGIISPSMPKIDSSARTSGNLQSFWADRQSLNASMTNK
jgi:hypothetical protein